MLAPLYLNLPLSPAPAVQLHKVGGVAARNAEEVEFEGQPEEDTEQDLLFFEGMNEG